MQLLLALQLASCDAPPEASRAPGVSVGAATTPAASNEPKPARKSERRAPVVLPDIHFGARVPANRGVPPRWHTPKVGDGWGCIARTDNSYACWAAATRPGEATVAHPVAWLDGKTIGVGPDRLCTREDFGVQCWRAPDFLVQESSDGTKPNTPSWIVALEPDSDVQFVRDGTPVTHGTRAGCSNGLCWGSADPSAATPICEVGPMLIPCALRDEPALSTLQHVGPGEYNETPIVGDLFTCRPTSNQGLFCVGASRDGWFGTAAECPAELRARWPILGDAAAAPRATCSRSPVLVTAGEFTGLLSSASSRGVCLGYRSHTDAAPICMGAIPPPPEGIRDVAVGLSEEPSACGLDEQGQLFCWGAHYSVNPPSAAPVRIDVRSTHASVAWEARGRFHHSCFKQTNCGRTARPIPACGSESLARTPAEVLAFTKGFEGTRISIRGTLGLIPTRSSGGAAIACGPFSKTGKPVPIEALGGGYGEFCCPAYGDAPVLVTDGPHRIVLDGSWCTGDSSRICCSLPVLGQVVIASGIFAWRKGAPESPEGWVLKNPELCALQRRPFDPRHRSAPRRARERRSR